VKRQSVARSRGYVEIGSDECKGCGLCVESCPVRVLRLGHELNRFGYFNAIYDGAGCTACGICFYVCPEPGGITIFAETGDEARDFESPVEPLRALALMSG
jgi:NAD-dependent dihydropyrimidine dehydrogenase PreA subunit